MVNRDAPPPRAWVIVAMLFLFMVVNFASKAVLGLAAVPIMTELHLSHDAFGTLSASFFYLFSLSCLVTGFIVNRINTTTVIFVMALVWGVCQLAAIGTVSFELLLMSRLALGVGEGPAFPVGTHAIYKWFPNKRRTLPSAIFSQGASFGVVITLPALNWLLLTLSWHWAFGVIGVIALFWAALWFWLGAEGPIGDPQHEAQPSRPIPYRRLIFNRTMISAWLSGFGSYWGVALLVSWFTPFLVEGLGFSQRQAGWLSTVPWALSILFAIAGSWVSERLIDRGVSSRIARGVYGGGMVAIGGLALVLLPLIQSEILAFIALVLGLSLGSVIYAMQPAIIAELTPVEQRGSLLAIGTAIWSLSGVVAPVVMGHLIDAGSNAAQSYREGFVVAGSVALVTGLIGMMLMQPEATRAKLLQATSVKEG